MKNISKQKRCAAAFIFLTLLSRNKEMEFFAVQFGKLTLNYLNNANDIILKYFEEDLATLFELFLNRIQKQCMTKFEVGLLGKLNDAMYEAIQKSKANEKSVDLNVCKQLILDICNSL